MEVRSRLGGGWVEVGRYVEIPMLLDDFWKVLLSNLLMSKLSRSYVIF